LHFEINTAKIKKKVDKSSTINKIKFMGNKNKDPGVPVIGGKVMEIGKFVYRMIVILSDHLNPKDQEMVVYEYTDQKKALKMKETILLEGISITRKDEGVEIDLFYPARQIRKIIIRREPLKMGRGSKIVH